MKSVESGRHSGVANIFEVSTINNSIHAPLGRCKHYIIIGLCLQTIYFDCDNRNNIRVSICDLKSVEVFKRPKYNCDSQLNYIYLFIHQAQKLSRYFMIYFVCNGYVVDALF